MTTSPRFSTRRHLAFMSATEREGLSSIRMLVWFRAEVARATFSQSSSESRQQVVSDISRALKIMAKELNVPVLCLSQLSRANENRPDKRPRLSDLRESGAIEQDADIVMFIYRDDYYDQNSENHNQAECIVAKNRHGELSTVPLQWLPEFTTFSSVDWKHQEP